MSRRCTRAVLVLAMALTAATAWAQVSGGVRGGDRERVPVLAAKDFNLATLEGRVVLLAFWNTTEEGCGPALAWLTTMQARYGDQGLTVVAVNIDRESNEAREMFSMLDPSVQVVLDPRRAMAARFELKTVPSSYLFDRTQEMKVSHEGFVAEDADDWEEEIAELLADKAE